MTGAGVGKGCDAAGTVAGRVGAGPGDGVAGRGPFAVVLGGRP